MTAELESIHSSTRANINTANLPFFLIFFYAAAAAAAGVFPVGVQSPNRVYTPSRPFMSFSRSLLTSQQHMREMSIMCVERKDLCVCILLGVAGLIRYIRLCHISINPQWIHIVIALPPPLYDSSALLSGASAL